MAQDPEIIDPMCLTPIFADGVSAEPNGSVTHLIFYYNQKGSDYRIAAARLVVPTDQLQTIMHSILKPQPKLRIDVAEDGESAKVH